MGNGLCTAFPMAFSCCLKIFRWYAGVHSSECHFFIFRRQDSMFFFNCGFYNVSLFPINLYIGTMKTEREKMLAGEVYDCGDEQLITRWHKAKRLMREYAATDTREHDKLNAILDELLGARGEGVWIAAPFSVDYGENIYLGENCEINFNCVFLDCNRITIGRNVLIAPNVQIYTVFHPVKAAERMPEGMGFCKSLTAPVTIGDNVWIGGGAIVLPGVTIGNNVTIGAGSVVTKSIPDDCLAVGNPCRVIRALN